MGNQKPSEPASVATNHFDPSQETIIVVVFTTLITVIVFALIILCVIKKKKEQEANNNVKVEDGEVQEELITSNNQSQVHATPGTDSQLKQGIRENPTRNPEHKKWYESKAIPYMDASVGSIPEAINGERV